MKVNYIIVGQGLAGSILAWELMQHEYKVLIIDNEKHNAASRVAAGLINPVTGQRLVKSDEADRCLPFAIDYYHKLEKIYKQAFYHALPMLRLFQCRADADRAKFRTQDEAYQAYLGEFIAPGQSGEPVNDSLGSIEQKQTGYLAIAPLLNELQDYFKKQHAYIATHFNYRDLIFNESFVQWNDYQAEYLVFCEGANAINNPWFRWLPFQLSKGEIISVRGEKRTPGKIINDGHWLVPMDEYKAKVGATFSWQWSDEEPSENAKRQLLEVSERMTASHNRWQVVDHSAGIRPTTKDKKPFIGFHPSYKRLLIFNGFGAKGSMLIPYYASRLVARFRSGQRLDPQVDIERFESGKSLTTLAKRYLSQTIKPGDIVVDATVGNGFDTEFLARCVGEDGKVIGFDVQHDAILATQQRLHTAHLTERVSLYQENHEKMSAVIDRSMHGNISAIAFNLGYLPGNAKSIKTQPETTLNAIDQAVGLIKPGGMISIICYPGHQGGEGETDAIKNRYCLSSETDVQVKIIASADSGSRAPELIIMTKPCSEE